MRTNIREQVGSDQKNVGVALSSGIDSTLVLALLRKEFPTIDIESISVKFSNSIDETSASKKISEKFKTNHHVLKIENFLEELPAAISIIKKPFWDIHWYYLSKEMKNFSNVFMSGDGGDELFGGYTFRYKKFLELTDENSSVKNKIIAYLNCHERDWVPDQEYIFGNENKFSWDKIYEILTPYFDNSLPRLEQVFLADYNGKLVHNMQPLYRLIQDHFEIKNISPIQNKKLLDYSLKIPVNLKYNSKTNSGKLILQSILEKYNVKDLLSTKKQGFSVDTVNLWQSYGQKLFDYYFDKSRIIESELINSVWLDSHVSKDISDVRYVNKFLGLLALEIWYRIFISKEMKYSEKLLI
ncbi:MAG: asparagine synthase [Chloroflexi bacterium]|nr:asparagine synthase [Chloroflexota bacterium]